MVNFFKKFQKYGMELLSTTVLDENRSVRDMYDLLEMKYFRKIESKIEQT
jgi:hypothetical protein